MREIIHVNEEKIKSSRILEKLGIEEGGYIILSAHREENIDNEENFAALMNAVNSMAEVYQIPVIYSMHPRSAKIIRQRGFQFHPLVKDMPPFAFSDYSQLMRHAFCVVSDSGTMPEEAAVSKFPAVCIRTSTERPEALDKGCFVIGGIECESILQSVDLAVHMQRQTEDVPDYADVNVSDKVIKIIQSYTRIIDRKVWGKL